jgi:FtsH-binding integral membrane protein
MNNYYGERWQDELTGRSVPLATVNSFVQRVFTIMAIGLLITGLTAYGFADWLMADPMRIQEIFGTPLRYLVMFAPLIFVFGLSMGINSMSFGVASAVFGLYAVSMGISLSYIFLIYTSGSIASTFLITAGTFGAMAVFGATTKTDLTKMGSYLTMALFGIIIASLVNLFLQSEGLMWVVTYIGVIVFTGLTAYDMQKIVRMGVIETNGVSEESQKASLLGALTLYLDFINLFLLLLRILGNRRD